MADGNTMAYSTIVKGDADAAMARADVVVKGRYVSDASQGVPIEPRAVVAQWQGDEVTIWSSTQVPYAARAGVAQTLQIPEANVRIVVPLLGGGFGAKCDLHFEAQVAALARAAKRPVKLVFSRREEFVAIAQRREGIAMEFETGVMRDGRIVARKAKLVLDKGAYCGEGGFLGQMAAMHACGPYVIDNVFVEAHLNYTNNQPSGSVRAPTAPQVCWGLEQHMDEVARAIDMDPVELRRRTLIEAGAEGPTRQVFDEIGMKQTLERAVEMIGYGRELPDDEAIGVAVGLVAVHAGAIGGLRPHQRRRERHDRDRRAGERQRRRDGDADVRGRGARHAARGLHDPVPGHRRGELGHGLVRLADDVQQRTRDPRRRGRRARAAARCRRRRARGRPRGPGARRRSGAGEGLARPVGVDRRSRRRRHDPREGLGRGARGARPVTPAGASGRLGNETFLAPQLITQAAHVKVDRATGVVRVLKVAAAHDSGVILNRRGADGQVTGGVVMGVGLALSEGTMLDDDGRQRNPALLDYKLVTCADAPEIEVDWIQIPAKGAGPRGSKGVGEPPQVPTAAAIANAISKVLGTQVRQLPMTPERVWAVAHGEVRA